MKWNCFAQSTIHQRELYWKHRVEQILGNSEQFLKLTNKVRITERDKQIIYEHVSNTLRSIDAPFDFDIRYEHPSSRNLYDEKCLINFTIKKYDKNSRNR